MEKPLLFLLVCEGPSDIPVIRRVAEEICRNEGKDIEIRHIAPQQDSTGAWERHGYVGVAKWCALYGKKSEQALQKLPENIRKAVIRKNWEALVKAASADGLIIQMDTDIVDQLNFLPNRFDETKDNRREYCKSSLLMKLGLQSTPENLVLLLPSYSTETWIIASFNEDHVIFKDLAKPISFEELDNCEDLLINADFKKERKHGKTRLKKSHDIYLQYAEIVANNITKVVERCQEVNSFKQNILQK
ncbi:TPA: hypothetical protein ACTW4A_004775 [Klebsiella pneumoniae]